MSTARRWQLADVGLVWRKWPGEDEVVAYSPRAGSVHLLTVSAQSLLLELSRGALTADEIAAFVARDTAVARPVIDDMLPELMQMLRDAELIQTAAQ